MSGARTGILLDMCAVIRLANGDPLPAQAVEAITQAGLSAGILIPPVFAWKTEC